MRDSYNKWYDNNIFVAFVIISIISVILFFIGSVIKSGYNKASDMCSAYKENAPQREQDRQDKETMKLVKKAKMQAQIQIEKEKLQNSQVTQKDVAVNVPVPVPVPVPKSPSIEPKTRPKDSWLKSCLKPSHPTLEEYLETEVIKWEYRDFPHLSCKEVDEFNRQHRADAPFEWERKYGDLMFHADGTLRDTEPGNDISAEGEYWILALVIYAVFFMWSGIGTGGNPMAIAIINLIGLIAAIIMYFTLW